MIASLTSALASEGGGAEIPELPSPGPLGFGLLLVVAVLILPLLGKLGRALAPGDELPRAPWRGVDLGVILGAGVLAFLASGLVLGLLGIDGTEKSGPLILIALLQSAFLLGSVGFTASATAFQRAGRRGLAALGLGRDGDGACAFLGLLSYALFAPLLWSVLLLWPSVAESLGIRFEPQEVLVDVIGLHGASLAVALVLAVAIVPFIEELLFRGFLQSLLIRTFGASPGIVFASIVFASLHGAAAFGPIFVLSLFLGWLQVRSGRLSASWSAHALHNALTLALVLANPSP